MSTSALTAGSWKSAGHWRSATADSGDVFADTTLACLLLIALPIKNSAYFVPPLFILMQFLSGNVGIVGRTLLWGCLAICISTVSIMIDSIYIQTVNPPGLLFGILTYSSLAVMLGLRSNFTISSERWQKLKLAVSWFVIIQSIIGLMQYLASGDPDTVCGTFGLLDFRGGITIGQVYLTFNLFAMILFLLTDMAGVLPKVAIVVGLLACILAHSGHQTLFFMAALAFVGMLQLRLRDVAKLGAVLLVVAGMMVSLSSIQWSDIEDWYEKVAVDEGSPKRMVTLSAVEIMSSPKNMLLGTGMGQYGSRAALISSGEYLTIPMPRALVGTSDYYLKSIVPAEYEHKDHGEDSAMSQPYYSVMNLIVEFGFLLTLLLLLGVTTQFFQNRRLSKSPDPHTRAVGVFANVGLVFFVLCCFIENYMEFPQAIFLPTLLYVAARSPRGPREPMLTGRPRHD